MCFTKKNHELVSDEDVFNGEIKWKKKYRSVNGGWYLVETTKGRI